MIIFQIRSGLRTLICGNGDVECFETVVKQTECIQWNRSCICEHFFNGENCNFEKLVDSWCVIFNCIWIHTTTPSPKPKPERKEIALALGIASGIFISFIFVFFALKRYNLIPNFNFRTRFFSSNNDPSQRENLITNSIENENAPPLSIPGSSTAGENISSSVPIIRRFPNQFAPQSLQNDEAPRPFTVEERKYFSLTSSPED